MKPASVFLPDQDTEKQEERFFHNESYYILPNTLTSLWTRLEENQRILETSVLWKSSSGIPFKVFKKDFLSEKFKDKGIRKFCTRNRSSLTALGYILGSVSSIYNKP